MAKRRIKLSEITVGNPLPWDIFDDNGNTLLKQGYVVEDMHRMESLAYKGMFIEVEENADKKKHKTHSTAHTPHHASKGKIADKQAAGTHGRRKNPRYAVSWRIVVVYKKDTHVTYQGRVTDLSLGGASFLSEVNIYSTDPVVVTIEIPPSRHRQEHIIVGTRSSILYSVLSSNYGMFRIALKFVDFNRNGKKDLAEALSSQVALGENKDTWRI